MSVQTQTLSEFLWARIAEDEATARAVIAEHEMYDWDSYMSSAGWYGGSAHNFALRFNPARVLTECEARRRLLEMPGFPGEQKMRERLLALSYASHPDYRDEWRL